MRHFILLTLRLLEMFFTCPPSIHAKGVIVIANSAGGGKGGNFNQRSGGSGGESFSMPPPHNIVIAYDWGFFYIFFVLHELKAKTYVGTF
jgi:hypothetical protein